MERLTEWIGSGPERKAIARQDRRDIGDKDCVTRLAAYEDTGLTPERVAELAEAEQAGRLVVLPGDDNDAVLAAVFRGEKPVVMHGGGDTDDLIALTHVLVSYAAETLGAGYTDFCLRMGEMSPTGFKNAPEAEAAVERKEEN